MQLYSLGDSERDAEATYEEAIRRRQDSRERVDVGKSPT
jgi:hypothetical protein